MTHTALRLTLLLLLAACGGPRARFSDDDGGSACEGPLCDATCGDEVCDANEGCSTCAEDCGACAAVACGDSVCNGTESCSTCSVDCGACVVCGDGTCNGLETCWTCDDDCGACAPACGDGSCNGSESCTSCDSDCGVCEPTPSCGDGACGSGESCGSCVSDCGPCETLFPGTVCNPMDRSFPMLAASSRDEALREAATMAREVFAARWNPEAEEADLYAVMTWTLNTLRQNGWVVFRALDPASTPASLNLEEDKLTGRDGSGTWTFDLFVSWQTPGNPQALAFEARAPYESQDLLDCGGADTGVPENTVFPDGDEPQEPAPQDLSATDRANVLASATYVRNNFPQFFAAEDRAVAYEMMTVVINDLRARGTDAMRCLAHADMPPTNPYRWCSDALVVGQPGRGITIDIYTSWPNPATPQVLLTGTGTTGEMTADLNQ